MGEFIAEDENGGNENNVCNSGPIVRVITKPGRMGLPVRTNRISKDNIQRGLEEILT